MGPVESSAGLPVRRYPAELPQGRKAARVGRLFRVRGEFFVCRRPAERWSWSRCFAVVPDVSRPMRARGGAARERRRGAMRGGAARCGAARAVRRGAGRRGPVRRGAARCGAGWRLCRAPRTWALVGGFAVAPDVGRGWRLSPRRGPRSGTTAKHRETRSPGLPRFAVALDVGRPAVWWRGSLRPPRIPAGHGPDLGPPQSVARHDPGPAARGIPAVRRASRYAPGLSASGVRVPACRPRCTAATGPRPSPRSSARST